jgi:hypothetical protein
MAIFNPSVDGSAHLVWKVQKSRARPPNSSGVHLSPTVTPVTNSIVSLYISQVLHERVNEEKDVKPHRQML